MTVVGRIATRCAQAGVRVVRVNGAERRGNGQSWGTVGGILNHHTGGGRNIYVDQILINGRSDLPGPLTNFATLYDGDLAVVAEHPANHAGASGGWDTAPLPVSRTFNRLIIGNEIQYPGTEPMSPQQWRTALIFNRIALEEIGFANQWNRVKFHQGTSVTGKWDAGFAPNRTYNITDFRKAVAGTLTEDDMTPQELMAHGVRNAFGQIVPYGLVVTATEGRVAALQGEVAGLKAGLAQVAAAVAADDNLDVDALIARIDETTRSAIADSVIDVDVTVQGKQA